jgi:hypothetical protein
VLRDVEKGAYKYISTQKITKRKMFPSSLTWFVWKWYVNIWDCMDSRVFFLLFFFCFDLFRLVRYRYAFDCKWQVCIHFLLLFAIFLNIFWLFFLL